MCFCGVSLALPLHRYVALKGSKFAYYETETVSINLGVFVVMGCVWCCGVLLWTMAPPFVC